MLRHVKHTDINHVPIRSLHPQEIIRKWSEKEWKEPHIVACVAVSRACENCKTQIKWWGSWTSCPSWTLCPRCKLDISLLTDFATFPHSEERGFAIICALYIFHLYPWLWSEKLFEVRRFILNPYPVPRLLPPLAAFSFKVAPPIPPASQVFFVNLIKSANNNNTFQQEEWQIFSMRKFVQLNDFSFLL